MRRLLAYQAACPPDGARIALSRDMPRAHIVRPKTILALALLAAGICLGVAGCASPSQVVTTHATATAQGTPTATPTALEALILRNLGGQAQAVTTAPGTAPGSLVVTITISGTIPSDAAAIAAAHERVKTLCYLTLRAMWASMPPAGEVTITVLGPTLDEYANRTINLYGSTIVESRTGARLDWAQLTPDSAWALYDHVYLVNDFYPVD
jgi:hypothetical protein